MIHEEVVKYRELSGDTNPNTPISRIGGYLDGYEKALEQELCDVPDINVGDMIIRQAAINSLIDNTHLDGYDLAEAIDAIENKEKLPSVSPQPKIGHWERSRFRSVDQTGETYDDGEAIVCSECRRAYKLSKMTEHAYCPRCGSYNGGEQQKNEQIYNDN